MSWVQEFADEHIAAFNSAVASRDFASFLARFDDDALMRFENMPGVGVLEFAGRMAYTSAYEQQPPDDQIEITGTVRDEGGMVVIPFTWRRDGSLGVLRLTVRNRRISNMVVTFA